MLQQIKNKIRNWFNYNKSDTKISIRESSNPIISNIENIDQIKLLTYINEQNTLNRGLDFSIQQLQFRVDELSCIIASLMLDSGKTDYLIKQNFFSTFMSGDMVVCNELEGDCIKVWLEKVETCENCGESCGDCE